MIVLELVITIADGARSNFTTPIGPALTVSSQLGQSRDLASCSVVTNPCSCFSSAVRPTRHRRELTFSSRVSRRASLAVEPRGPGVAPARRLAQPGASKWRSSNIADARLFFPHLGPSPRQPHRPSLPPPFRCRCPSREFGDWHSRPHRHLAQRKSKMDQRRRTVAEYKARHEWSVATPKQKQTPEGRNEAGGAAGPGAEGVG